MYRSQDRDKERVLSTLEFLNGETQEWYHCHVLSVNHERLHWTFEEVILGLHDRFIQPSTMQDARKDFHETTYNAAMGIQGYYDILLDHAQNIVIFPDAYQIMERFLSGIPEDIREKIFECGLSPKVNTIDDLVACAKAIEISKKTVAYYHKKTATMTTSSPAKIALHRLTTEPKTKQVMYVCHPRFESKLKETRKDQENHRCPSCPIIGKM